MSSSFSPRSFPDMTGAIIGRTTDISLVLLDHLGSGGFGAVYRARDSSQPRSSPAFAVKVMKKPAYCTSKDVALHREILHHHAVSAHPNIVTFRESILDNPDYVYLIMDYCTGGNLFSLYMTTSIFARNDSLVRRLSLQLISAVEYCHSKGIFHRDLKPENILVNSDCTQVYITDFGLSTNREESDNFHVGSVPYMSPECLNKAFMAHSYSCRRSDIWALGVILFNIVTGESPWFEPAFMDPGFAAFMHHRKFLRNHYPISESFDSLLRNILTPNPSMSIDLETFRDEVYDMDTFFMSEREIKRGSLLLQQNATYLNRLQRKPNPPAADKLALNVNPLPPVPLGRKDEVDSDDSSSDEGTDSDSDSDSGWGESTPGVRMRRALPIITDPDLHKGQGAWRKEKQAALRLDQPEVTNRSPSAPAPLCLSASTGGSSSEPSSTTGSTPTAASSPAASSQKGAFKTSAHESVTSSGSVSWAAWAIHMRHLLAKRR